MDQHITNRIFLENDQLAFATLSGDFNPLHVNARSARRQFSGGLVVHGIHLLLWALDFLCERCTVPFAIDEINALFAKPVLVGVEVQLALVSQSPNRFTIILVSNSVEVATISVSFQQKTLNAEIISGIPDQVSCKELSSNDLLDYSGSLNLYFDYSRFHCLFPSLCKILPHVQLSCLLATTRLVGVECPGQNSIFYSLNLHLRDCESPSLLNYYVSRFDNRFNLLTLTVNAPGLCGKLQAFLRPVPMQQPTCNFIRTKVERTQFSGQRALVVGGSRGLGEVVAKVLAMGGAEVHLSYHVGADEAKAIVNDILDEGGQANSFCMNVLDVNPFDSLNNLQPTHVYYMATPFISNGNRSNFSPAMFKKFCSFYVDGFIKLFEYINTPVLQGVFYPSSVFLDEQPLDMMEYILAKSAGETLVKLMQKSHPSINFLLPRLPRLSTDQTNSLMPVANSEPLPILLSTLLPFQVSR